LGGGSSNLLKIKKYIKRKIKHKKHKKCGKIIIKSSVAFLKHSVWEIEIP
jgi:hypothetical protein